MKRLPYYLIILTMALVLVACVRPLQEEQDPADGAAPETSAPIDSLQGDGTQDGNGGDASFTFEVDPNAGAGDAGTEGTTDGSGGEGAMDDGSGGEGAMDDGSGGEGAMDDGSGGENAGTTEQPTTDNTNTTSTGDTIHTIASGDVLGRIAEQYGVSVEDIMIANGMNNADYLNAGDQLVIPTSGNVTAPAGGGAGEGPASTGSGSVHTVQPGDTLYSIALRYGTTVETLAAFNGIVNVNSLDVGQQVSIP